MLLAPETDPDWLVPNLMIQGALVCLVGEAGAGKSYISYLIGLAIAAGCKALGNIVPAGEPKRVLYFDEENSEQDRNKYLRRCWKGLTAVNGTEPDLGLLIDNFWARHMVLGDDDWMDAARFEIENVAAVTGGTPHLLVFDTATPAFNIQSENDNAEATQVVKGVRTLMRLCNPVATALILKHEKTWEKGGQRSMRGAKAWKGMADGVMFQIKAAGRPRKDGLKRTRLEPDKTRAYGLTQTIYISPRWTDGTRNGLALDASYTPDKYHKEAEALEGGDDE